MKYQEMGCFNLTCRGYQVAKVAMTTKYKEDPPHRSNNYPPPNTHPLTLSWQPEREEKRERNSDTGRKISSNISKNTQSIHFESLKGLVHMKTKVLSSFTHPHVSLSPYFFTYTYTHKRDHIIEAHITCLMVLFHCVVRLGTVQNGTVRVGFVFPLQFSTALEWVGLFTCRYSCAASTAVTPEKLFNSASLHHALAGSAPRLSMRGQSVLPQQTTKQPFFCWLKKVRSFKTVAFDPSLAVLI